MPGRTQLLHRVHAGTCAQLGKQSFTLKGLLRILKNLNEKMKKNFFNFKSFKSSITLKKIRDIHSSTYFKGMIVKKEIIK